MPPKSTANRSRDLPELELECMKVLWETGDLTVRAVRDRLLARRPLAYTTVLTVLDRLTQKGAVSRRKSGRAHLYHPVYTLSEAREAAVTRVLEHFFGGSRDLLLQHLSVSSLRPPGQPAKAADAVAAEPDHAGFLDPTLL